MIIMSTVRIIAIYYGATMTLAYVIARVNEKIMRDQGKATPKAYTFLQYFWLYIPLSLKKLFMALWLFGILGVLVASMVK